METITQKGNVTQKGKRSLPKKVTQLSYLYGFNKNYETWKPLPKKVTLPKKVKGHYPKRVPQKKTIQKKVYTPEFLKFWSEYPNHKSGKVEAFKSYEKAIKNNGPDLSEVILKSLADHKKYSWKDPDFIPYATTWLNQSRWEAGFKNGEPEYEQF